MADNELKKELLKDVNNAIKLYSKKLATEIEICNIKQYIEYNLSVEDLAMNLYSIVLKDDSIFLTKNKESFMLYIADNIKNVKKTITEWFNYFTMEIKY